MQAPVCGRKRQVIAKTQCETTSSTTASWEVRLTGKVLLSMKVCPDRSRSLCCLYSFFNSINGAHLAQILLSKCKFCNPCLSQHKYSPMDVALASQICLGFCLLNVCFYRIIAERIHQCRDKSSSVEFSSEFPSTKSLVESL